MQYDLADSDVLSIARKYNADIAITGTVSDFDFGRKGAGAAMLGGYKSYTAKVTVEQVRIFRVATGEALGTVRGEKNTNDRGLGLELFGKPRQMDLEFYSLDSLDFGSKRFLTTLLGQTTIEALAAVHQEIRSVVTRPDSMWYETKKFKVISLEPGAAMINAGTLDGVAPGDRFNVFAAESGVRVGKISILNVWSDHVSRQKSWRAATKSGWRISSCLNKRQIGVSRVIAWLRRKILKLKKASVKTGVFCLPNELPRSKLRGILSINDVYRSIEHFFRWWPQSFDMNANFHNIR